MRSKQYIGGMFRVVVWRGGRVRKEGKVDVTVWWNLLLVWYLMAGAAYVFWVDGEDICMNRMEET